VHFLKAQCRTKDESSRLEFSMQKKLGFQRRDKTGFGGFIGNLLYRRIFGGISHKALLLV
jgi:hypothetical protein